MRLIIFKIENNGRDNEKRYLLKCDCGKGKEYWMYSWQYDKGIGLRCHYCAPIKHNMSYTRIYNNWQNIIDRVYNPNSRSYQSYKDKNITICDRWLKFENFNEDLGSTKEFGYKLMRIDMNRGFEPNNCVWMSPEDSASHINKWRFGK